MLEIETVERPAPQSDQVLLRVQASTVNPHDAIVRSGGLKLITGRKFPLGVGLDFAGTVSETGADVQGMSVGTKVWGMVSPKGGHVTGAAAQYVVVPADRIAAMPEPLSMTDAASLVTSGSTALRALRDIAHVKAGERALIRGAAGGVGMIAVQLARALGTHVTALASQRDHEFVTGLGAHETLDYRAVKPQELEPFHVILDTTGTDLLAFRRRLTRDGRMVTIAFSSGKRSPRSPPAPCLDQKGSGRSAATPTRSCSTTSPDTWSPARYGPSSTPSTPCSASPTRTAPSPNQAATANSS